MKKSIVLVSILLTFLFLIAPSVQAFDNESTMSKEQFLEEFIGSEDKPGALSELFSRPVSLVNHYLYMPGEYHRSINIEHLSFYMRYYGSKSRVQYCDYSLNYDRNIQLTDYATGASIRTINSIFENPSLLYTQLGDGNNDLKSELAMFELCKFSYYSSLFLNFDPVGISSAGWGLEIGKSRVESICKVVTQKLTSDLLGRDSIHADNINTDFLCRFDQE